MMIQTRTIRESIAEECDGRWAGDARHALKLDEVGFLLELTPVCPPNPRKRLEIRPHPGRLAGSLEEMLFGVITGDRTDVECLGVAKVTEVAPNGRGRVQTLWGDEARQALEQLGYPELAEDLHVADGPTSD